MVFLDVVYNHFGPEGNYLGRYAPAFFTEAQTPWGSAIDYRVPQVRAFAIENALHWLRDYRFDGLRLDAVHAHRRARRDRRCCTISAVAVGELAAETGRHIHLVLENDDNRASLLDADAGSAARQISRAVERRLSSRLARAADRRDARAITATTSARRLTISRARWLRLRLSGRSVRASRRQAARRAERRARAHRLRQFPAEPRPDRQPRARRPARKRRRRPRRSKPRSRSPCWRR